MKRVLWICSIVIIFTIGSNRAYGQNNSWQFVNDQFIPGIYGELYEISSGGQYIFTYDDWLIASDTSDLTRTPMINHMRGHATPWLGDTILFKEYASDGSPSPNCQNASLLPVGVWNAATEKQQLFCVNAPQVSTVDRDPFNPAILFGDNRYLINLQSNLVQDLKSSLTTQVTVQDTLNWNAYARTWWDSQTHLPMAMLTVLVDGAVDYFHDVQETIMLCPMTQQNCRAIVRVQDKIRGNLADMVLSPDGQTVLWSAFQIASTSTIHPGPTPNGEVEDAVVFATNIQSGTTSEIFRFSRHNTSPALPDRMRWSADGTVLAIVIKDPDGVRGISSQDSGMFLVNFMAGR